MGSTLVWQLVLIQGVTFVALVVGLRWLFSRQLKVALKRLQALQEEAMVKEAELKEELQRAKEEREEEIGKLDATHFSLQTGMCRVVSSFALSAPEQQQLQRALSDKARVTVELEEHIDPTLIAGLVVYLGPLVIDGSLKNSLHKAVAV